MIGNSQSSISKKEKAKERHGVLPPFCPLDKIRYHYLFHLCSFCFTLKEIFLRNDPFFNSLGEMKEVRMLNEKCHYSLPPYSRLYLSLGLLNMSQDILLQCLTFSLCVRQGKTQNPATGFLFLQKSINWALFIICLLFIRNCSRHWDKQNRQKSLPYWRLHSNEGTQTMNE